jgi:tetratricopeptide (TPR) repeat protein
MQLQDDHRKNRIVRVGGGYKLLIADEQLDALVFRKLTLRARDEADVEHSCGIFAEALSLWRGSPLEDVEPLRSHPAVVALSDERIAVALEYAKRASSVGDHDAVLVHLAPLCSDNSLDERLHAALMIALAGSGRQAEALSVYEEMRARLDEELGMPPGEELRAAHQRILRQEVVTRTPSQAWRAVRQLPPAPVDFTGRKAEVAAVVAAATAHDDELGVPIVLISGQPGVGKTALGLHAAHALSVDFPDGQLWVHLAGASSRPREPTEVLAELLRAVGVPGSAIPDDAAQRSAALRSALAGRRVLVFADDAASMEQVAPLVPGTAGCALISTSRMHLAGFPGASHIPVNAFPTEDGVSLLAGQIGTERVSAEPNAAVELVNACGGLPLALRIVGGKLAARPRWPVSVMMRRLAQAEKRLGEFDAGNLSVRASIASSYRTLPELHQTAFRRLAILGPNDFAGWIVEVLLGESGSEDILDNLIGRSFVIPAGVDLTGEPRYRLHDILRDYAAEQLALDPSADTDLAIRRLVEAWLQLALLAQADLLAPPYYPSTHPDSEPTLLRDKQVHDLVANPIAWYTSERVNLQAAIKRACETGQLNIAYDLAVSLYAYHQLQDRYDAAEQVWRMVGDAAVRAGRPAEQAHAGLRVAAAMLRQGRSADAIETLDTCIRQFREVEADDATAFALYWRSLCAWDLDDFDAARRYAEEGRAMAWRVGERYAELANTRMVGLSLALIGDKAGVEVCEQAMELARELDSDSYTLVTLHSLALACCHAGQHDRALKVAADLVRLSRKLGDARAEATAHGLIADSHLAAGRFEDALAVLLEALSAFGPLQAPRHRGLCLLKLGQAYEGMERWPDAIACLDKSLEIFEYLRLPRKYQEAQAALGRCRAVIGTR